jgi:peptide/nickel transport system substrate-binding protein
MSQEFAMTLTRRATLGGLAALPMLARTARAARGSQLNFGLSSYPPSLLPWVNAGSAAAAVKLQLFRGLLSFAPDGSLQGELASAWSHDGESGWTFTLRDAAFSNGEKVTSADVKWTIEQVAAEKSTAALRGEMQGVARVETPDDRTVRIVTKTPTVTLGETLAGSAMPIVWHGSDPKEPVGAGPYTIASMERGAFIELAASPHYYKPGLPKLRTLRFVAYPDDNLRVAALQAGDVDMIEYVPWQSMNDVSHDPKLSLSEHDGPFMYLTFNATRPPFDDARVRLAVANGVKREDIIAAAFFGRGSPLGHLPIPRASAYANPELDHAWGYDPARAKALLAEAGHPDGFDCTLLATAQYGMHKDTAAIVQQHLATIGIRATLNLPDWPTRVRLGNQGQFDFAVMGTGPDTNDPDGVASVIDGALSPSYVRSFGLKTPELTALLAQGRAEFDPAKRHDIYRRMEQAAIDIVPIAGLTWRSQAYAMARKVQGFSNLPGMLTFMSPLTLETTSVG